MEADKTGRLIRKYTEIVENGKPFGKRKLSRLRNILMNIPIVSANDVRRQIFNPDAVVIPEVISGITNEFGGHVVNLGGEVV